MEDNLARTLTDENITVIECPLHAKALCLEAGRMIGIDRAQCRSTVEANTVLAHEVGHFLSGAFYKPFSPFQIRGQAEYRADRAAIQHFVPLDYLRQNIKEGRSLSDLSEDIGLSEEYILKAYLYYKDTLGVSFE